MQSTLYVIPHALLGLPVFGLGWAAIGVLVALAIRWAYGRKVGESTASFQQSLPTWGIVVLLMVFLFPRFELQDMEGNPLGIPIRGYGVMLLLAVASGLGLALLRARRLNMATDTILALAFWLFCGGILGARAFYVIQKWDEFRRPSLGETLWKIVQFTEGGLVVFGALMGALFALVLFARLRRLPILPLGDLVLPSFLVGQSLGRIGCLLNGCCFGGVCELPLPAIQFPHGSLPYIQQLSTGELLGLQIKTSPNGQSNVIEKVAEGSVAAKLDWPVGATISELKVVQFPRLPHGPTEPIPVGMDTRVNGIAYFVGPADLPKWSLRTHPAQLYAALDAAILAGLLWFLWPFLKRDGMIIGLGLGLHAVSRFLLEWIRTDESTIFGTPLTISQLISVLLFVGGLSLLINAFAFPTNSRADLGKPGTA
jgi:phosphatidylglycerol:prolipoprotein diacylglycerol transferase